MKKELGFIVITLIASALSAFGLHIFVYPASFAPAGVDGIATMLQSATGLNAGYYSLIINIPLLVVAYFLLKKRYVVYTVIFTVLSSVMLIVLKEINFYQYVSDNSGLIASVFSGVMLGVRTGIMLKIGASTGGVDIVAGIVQHKRAYGNIEKVITFICYAIIGVSFFVYNNDLNSVLLSVIQMFVFERASAAIMKDTRSAVEFKIITRDPEGLKNDIIYGLKHGATLIKSTGMFTEEGNSIIISVVNIRQIPEFLRLIKRYPDTFVYYTDVSGVKGNFRWKKDDVAK